MNIQKLKERLLDVAMCFSNATLKEQIEICFYEFSLSNKSDELPKETKEFINIWKEIEGMKKEISEQYSYTKKYIACIDECRAEIETLKKQVEEMKAEINVLRDLNPYLRNLQYGIDFKKLVDKKKKKLPKQQEKGI